MVQPIARFKHMGDFDTDCLGAYATDFAEIRGQDVGRDFELQ